MKGTMTSFLKNIEELSEANQHFRQVLYTSQHTQLVVMSLQPLEDIGLETHAVTDQFIRVESGAGQVNLNGELQPIAAGDALIIPAGTQHNLINKSSEKALKLYTIYSPPHHNDGTIHHTKAAAEADQNDHL